MTTARRETAARQVRATRNEDGVALLVVLLVITLLTVVVVELTYSTEVETHLAFSGRNALQASYLARSGVNMGEALLAYGRAIKQGQLGTMDRSDPRLKADSDADEWAKPFPPLPLGDGTVELRIRDESRALDLNALTQGNASTRPGRIQIAERIFRARDVEPAVLHAIVDWVDADPEPYPPDGAEQSFYFRSTPPIHVRNGPLVTWNELRLVRGVTPTVLERLEGFVTVIPRKDDAAAEGLKININTAPRIVLLAFANGDTATADYIAGRRLLEPFTTKSWAEEAPGAVRQAMGDAVRFNSDYFRIETVGVVNDVRRGIVATVRRDEGNAIRQKITRALWFTTNAPPSLTSLPASDFLRTLPPIGGSG